MEDEAWSLSVKRRHALSLYHYLLTAGLSPGQISKSICPRFHSENREREGWRASSSSHKGREGRGKSDLLAEEEGKTEKHSNKRWRERFVSSQRKAEKWERVICRRRRENGGQNAHFLKEERVKRKMFHSSSLWEMKERGRRMEKRARIERERSENTVRGGDERNETLLVVRRKGGDNWKRGGRERILLRDERKREYSSSLGTWVQPWADLRGNDGSDSSDERKPREDRTDDRMYALCFTIKASESVNCQWGEKQRRQSYETKLGRKKPQRPVLFLDYLLILFDCS